MPIGDDVLRALKELEVPSTPKAITKFLKTNGYSVKGYKKLLQEVTTVCEIGATHGFIEECQGQYFSIKQTGEMLDAFDANMMLDENDEISGPNLSDIETITFSSDTEKSNGASKPGKRNEKPLFEAELDIPLTVSNTTESVLSEQKPSYPKSVINKQKRGRKKKKIKIKPRKKRKTETTVSTIETDGFVRDGFNLSLISISLPEPHIMSNSVKKRYINLIKSFKSMSVQPQVESVSLDSTEYESETDNVSPVVKRKTKQNKKRKRMKKVNKRLQYYDYVTDKYKPQWKKKKTFKAAKPTRKILPKQNYELYSDLESDVSEEVLEIPPKVTTHKTRANTPKTKKATHVGSTFVANGLSAEEIVEPCTSGGIVATRNKKSFIQNNLQKKSTVLSSEKSNSKIQMVLRSGRKLNE